MTSVNAACVIFICIFCMVFCSDPPPIHPPSPSPTPSPPSYSCPRYLTPACHGPYTVRASSKPSTLLPNQCLPDQNAAMDACLRHCLGERCCRTFGLSGAQDCVTSNSEMAEYEFVKVYYEPYPDDCHIGKLRNYLFIRHHDCGIFFPLF